MLDDAAKLVTELVIEAGTDAAITKARRRWILLTLALIAVVVGLGIAAFILYA